MYLERSGEHFCMHHICAWCCLPYIAVVRFTTLGLCFCACTCSGRSMCMSLLDICSCIPHCAAHVRQNVCSFLALLASTAVFRQDICYRHVDTAKAPLRSCQTC